MLTYQTPPWLTAFTTGAEPFPYPIESLGLPRQTHTDHVVWMHAPGRPEDTDAVITDVPGLPLAVKTADCIPILLYDRAERRIAAVHAGWRGTVQDIVGKTIEAMQHPEAHNAQGRPTRPENLSAIIGPGISVEAFEVGDEVYEAFATAGFPMERIARKYQKWHLDLWEANRWLLQRRGITDIHLAAICTFSSPTYYSARRDTIHTGRNMNCIVMVANRRVDCRNRHVEFIDSTCPYARPRAKEVPFIPFMQADFGSDFRGI